MLVSAFIKFICYPGCTDFQQIVATKHRHGFLPFVNKTSGTSNTRRRYLSLRIHGQHSPGDSFDKIWTVNRLHGYISVSGSGTPPAIAIDEYEGETVTETSYDYTDGDFALHGVLSSEYTDAQVESDVDSMLTELDYDLDLDWGDQALVTYNDHLCASYDTNVWPHTGFALSGCSSTNATPIISVQINEFSANSQAGAAHTTPAGSIGKFSALEKRRFRAVTVFPGVCRNLLTTDSDSVDTNLCDDIALATCDVLLFDYEPEGPDPDEVTYDSFQVTDVFEFVTRIRSYSFGLFSTGTGNGCPCATGPP